MSGPLGVLFDEPLRLCPFRFLGLDFGLHENSLVKCAAR